MRRLTKKLEGEILKLYHAYWDAYLAGDFKAFASYLDENTTVFGTAQGEVFTSRQETVKFYKATADQMTGKADFRKRKISASAVGDTIMVNEQSDLYVLVDGAWVFYGHSRITAIFEQKGNSWKLVHQHASFPDTRAEEGEQVATKKIQKENIELRDAVKRRTVELEEKNRELEIETALEKVRAVALGMKKAEDMLSICKTISQQLAKLGVKEIRNVQTAIFNVPAGTYMNYEFYAKHDKTFITETLYTNHKVARAFAAKMLKGKGEVSITHIRGKEKVKEWLNYQKGTNVFIDTYLKTATSLSYYWFSLGPVALGISTYCPLSNEELQLFQRFLKVFELAYRRYLDIEKAVAQAREAQIEAALERIRARALAMHSSDEFTDVARVMREQMGQLGQQELETSAVHLYNEDAKTIYSWRAFRLSSDLKSKINYGFFKIPKNSCEIAREFVQKFKSKATDYTIEVSGARQTEWYKVLFKLAPEVQAAMKKSGTTKDKRFYHFSKFSGGSLLMVSSKAPSNDAIELQKRAAQVFDLAYRRFKDLQKAEVQAREAQIEAALERVRAASLAMQDSSALGEIIYKLYGELTKLDAKLDRCFIMIVNPDNKGITWWLAGKEGLLAENGFFIPMNQHPSHLMYLDHWKKRKKKWQYLFEGKEKRDWDRYGFAKTELAKLPQPVKKDMAEVKKIFLSGSSDSFGCLVTGSMELLSDEHQDIINRFAVVFNQTYTRFLDLQKAEAQSREAQIELALERVRARTMAMQKSSELKDIAHELRVQLAIIGTTELETCAINLYEESDEFLEAWAAVRPPDSSGDIVEFHFHLSKKGIYIIEDILNAYTSGVEEFLFELSGEKGVQWMNIMEAQIPGMFAAAAASSSFKNTGEVKAWFSCSFFSGGALIMITMSPPLEESRALLKRCTQVFGLAYRRFADLKKAEAQTKEAEIQLALERIRARSLAMHQTDELQEVVNVVAQQLMQMGIDMDGGVFIAINEEVNNDLPIWAAAGAADYVQKVIIPFLNRPTFTRLHDAIIRRQPLYTEVYSKKDKNEFLNHLFRHHPWNENSEQRKKELLAREGGYVRSVSISQHTTIGITNHHGKQFTDAENDILKRFGAVLEQSYTRFLDLQRAEAQAREAQIETSLEKVRSRSMAMQQPEELVEVAELLRKEMGQLGVEELETSSIYLVDKERKQAECWYAIKDVREEDTRLVSDEMPLLLTDTWVGKQMWKFYQSGEERTSILMKGERRREWINYCAQHSKVLQGYYGDEIPDRTYHLVKFNGGYIGAAAPGDISAESWDLLKRVSTVFSLAYTRFKDLQDAAARAREAQIELALERVRSRSMAMHKSEELKEVIRLVLDQFIHLNINAEHAGFYIDYKAHDDMHIWLADPNIEPFYATLPYFDTPTWNSFLDAKAKGNNFFTDLLSFEEKNKFYQCLFKIFEVPEEAKKFYMECKGLAVSTVLLDNVGLYIENFHGIPYTEEENKILMRFGKVFQQTYTRFLDLQKAEAQAREAQIEAALEKVRSRTMAMQNSNELQETAAVLFQEFKKLGTENIYQVTIGIYNEEEGVIDFRVTSWEGSGKQEDRSFTLSMEEPTVVQPAIAAWKANKKSVVIDLSGETLEGWLNYRNKISGITVKSADTGGRRVITAAYYSKGHLSISTPVPVPADTVRILERFAAVFDSTYTRFLDLKKAEAQTKEAQIEAALEKVRSRTLAMQKSDELAETAAEVFKQLISLGIEPNRLYIGIVNGDTRDMEMWATDEDGTGVGKKFTFNAKDNASVKKLFDGWLSKIKSVTVDMQGRELEDYIKYLQQLKIPLSHALTQKRRVQSVAYFDKGFIGMASPDEQSENNIHLLERFAAVFNLTFTRFNDLQIAEAHAQQAEQDLIAIKEAKQKAEDALTELQATQKQLIQSEKMASLGELTAGIAHEIQNPLNFVNNFSEVSKELLDEMKEAIEKGDTEEAKEIMHDVIQNLEKINHHGKRADGIVKGMLQHSRSSSGQKELTDINALCDEYLRLAYHGLRAKDKSFNAKFETELDAAVGKISLLPQDMGRVILNLINNAFYAVSERKKADEPGYEPTVTVSTLKKGNTVEIKVTDNGTGIPQKVLDKIFQPFFTTKPTGQGTGLGLSLSYDIVTKGHSGELKVETKEGEGTSFIILLPA